MAERYRLEWDDLTALEAMPHEVEQHAAALSAGYNDPKNAPLMGHADPITPTEVVDSYAKGIAGGMRAFLLFRSGELVGDADFRGLRGGSAEFAFMIAAPSIQGQGLGTRFALMMHALGFRELSLQRIYASVVPDNVASRRVFEKLGYVVDSSRAARAYADDPGDITLALDRPAFVRRHTLALAVIRMALR